MTNKPTPAPEKPYVFGRVAPAPDGRYGPAPKPRSALEHFNGPTEPVPEMVPVERKRIDPGSTYFGRSMAGLDGDGPVGTGESYVIGSEETTVNAPLPPSPIAWDQNLEPPTGESGAVPDMTTLDGSPRDASALAVECPYSDGDGGCVLQNQEIGPCLCQPLREMNNE